MCATHQQTYEMKPSLRIISGKLEMGIQTDYNSPIPVRNRPRWIETRVNFSNKVATLHSTVRASYNCPGTASHPGKGRRRRKREWWWFEAFMGQVNWLTERKRGKKNGKERKGAETGSCRDRISLRFTRLLLTVQSSIYSFYPTKDR